MDPMWLGNSICYHATRYQNDTGMVIWLDRLVQSHMRMIQTNATVDGSEIRATSWLIWQISHCLQGLSGYHIHVRWCRISSINSTTNNHIGWIPPKLYDSKHTISWQLLTPNGFWGVPLLHNPQYTTIMFAGLSDPSSCWPNVLGGSSGSSSWTP